MKREARGISSHELSVWRVLYLGSVLVRYMLTVKCNTNEKV